MISEYLLDCIKKQKYELVIYPNDLFDLRIQEEMIRADEDKSFFVYAEFLFEQIQQTLPPDEEKKFWKSFAKCLSSQGRGSDVVGLLGNGKGVGIILVDSKMDGWARLAGRLREFSKDSVSDPSKPLDTVKVFVYPAYIESGNA